MLERLQRESQRAPLVVAHRGSSSTHPENTLAALRAAVADGAHVVEFDVQQTKDGRWICMHDTTLDRTTDAVAQLGRPKVRVADVTFEQIRALDAGSWFDAKFEGERVPTLAAALAVILPGAVPMIERKGGAAEALVDELRRLDVVDRVLVQSFDWDFLAVVHRAEPRLLIGALGSGELTSDRRTELRRTGARIIHWARTGVTVEAAKAVRSTDQLLCVYTANPDIELLGAAALGCHLVTTDRPARMAWLRREGLLRGPTAR